MEGIQFLLLLLVPAALADNGCVSGFIANKDSCYAFPDLNTTWAQAKVYCQAVGADLAIVENQLEEDFILAEIVKQHGSAPEGGNYWLDGCDYLEEGDWIWASSGQKITFAKWAPGQPDNDDATEHCLHISLDLTSSWNDENCRKHLRFVCEHVREGGIGIR